MHCFTIREEAVEGIQVKRDGDELYIRIGDVGVPLEESWSRYILTLVDDALVRIEGRRMSNPPYVTAGDFTDDGSKFMPAGRLFGKDHALVRLETDAGIDGKVEYQSAMFMEEMVNGRVRRNYLPLRNAAGVEIMRPEGAAEHTPSDLIVMAPGATIRIYRTGALEDAWRTRTFTWWGEEMSWSGKRREYDLRAA